LGTGDNVSPALKAEIRDQVEHGRALIASTRMLLEGRRDVLRRAADSINPLHRDRRFYGETAEIYHRLTGAWMACDDALSDMPEP
jgi:hypothetical protein